MSNIQHLAMRTITPDIHWFSCLVGHLISSGNLFPFKIFSQVSIIFKKVVDVTNSFFFSSFILANLTFGFELHQTPIQKCSPNTQVWNFIVFCSRQSDRDFQKYLLLSGAVAWQLSPISFGLLFILTSIFNLKPGRLCFFIQFNIRNMTGAAAVVRFGQIYRYAVNSTFCIQAFRHFRTKSV